MQNKRTTKKNKNKKDLYKNIFGISLIAIGIILIFSFTSYFINWKEDQSLLNKLVERDLVAKNALGKIGNLLGNFFISGGLGIMSFFIPFFLIFIGLRTTLRRKILSIGSTLSAGLFLCIWTPIFLFFIAPNQAVLSGAIGIESNLVLESLVGKIGIGILLLTTLLLFIVSYFNFDFGEFLTDFSSDETTEENVLEENRDIEIPKETKPKTEKLNTKKTPEISNEIGILEKIKSNDFPEKVNLASTKSDLNLTVEKVTEESTVTEIENPILKKMGEYDPQLDLPKFRFPTLSLLKEYGGENLQNVDQAELEGNKNKIVETLGNYNIKISKIKATIGPTITLYEIIPEAGIRISKIKNLEDDIALSLSALGIRIIAPIPGKGTIGIEVPNSKSTIVSMHSVIASKKFQDCDLELPIAIGKTISNETFITDLAKMPHLLMAGATGQGKSVGLNAIITSLLYKKHPAELKFVFVDPKKVELTLYNKIERHYLAKLPDSEEAIITDNAKVINTLNSLCIEMDDRYELLKQAYVRNIKEYNKKFKNRKLNPENGHRFLPYIVLVIDEFADLIMTAGKEVELPIARLAQLARAIGIHLIIATQRPSVNVITGMIKANFPARIAFRVTSKIDSRTILDASGADQLIGKGDLLLTTGNNMTRLQCAFVDTPEIDEITEYIGSQKGYTDAHLLPEYSGEESTALDINLDERDILFSDAAKVIVATQQGSASLLQRKLKLGYNRAGRIIDQLEAAGIVGPFEGSKARLVMVQDEMSLEQLLVSLDSNKT